MTSPPWTGNAVFHWLLLAWPWINREAELGWLWGGFSCRSRDARFVFVELTVWGCLLTDGDRDGCVVTLCRAYVLSVPELVNMLLLLLLLFFFKVVGLFFFNLTKIIPTWAQRMGGLWALEKRSRPAGCWRVALEALQLWNVQNPDASWKNQRWGSTISHTTMILHDLFIIFGPETWSREPLGCGRDRVRSLQLLPL